MLIKRLFVIFYRSVAAITVYRSGNIKAVSTNITAIR
jgi:hypothetical protein